MRVAVSRKSGFWQGFKSEKSFRLALAGSRVGIGFGVAFLIACLGSYPTYNVLEVDSNKNSLACTLASVAHHAYLWTFLYIIIGVSLSLLSFLFLISEEKSLEKESRSIMQSVGCMILDTLFPCSASSSRKKNRVYGYSLKPFIVFMLDAFLFRSKCFRNSFNRKYISIFRSSSPFLVESLFSFFGKKLDLFDRKYYSVSWVAVFCAYVFLCASVFSYGYAVKEMASFMGGSSQPALTAMAKPLDGYICPPPEPKKSH
ncbi:hypothetical protein NQF87_00125 [Bombella sp. TMW 2.2559]|uniref:Uncharacterized protein n=1 Tax=Bombella dulcis TaxID=2967339 RepID=A0ABT3W928_9PROT|nr:hypothetical protein [Bombella dulcis]MCX5615391.1 hypothetical protein [Bombella dulcis]